MSQSTQNSSSSPRMAKEFPILGVSRADLEELGYEATNLDDATMQRIAHDLAEDSFEQMFSETLDWVAERFNIPKKGKRDQDETIESLLRQGHSAELGRIGATGWILGFFNGPTKVESKTDQGILLSEINPESKEVKHRWQT